MQNTCLFSGDGTGSGGHVQPSVQELRGGRPCQRHHVLLQPRQWRADVRRLQPALQDGEAELGFLRVSLLLQDLLKRARVTMTDIYHRHGSFRSLPCRGPADKDKLLAEVLGLV